ncbi:MAG: carbohydrate ABC transporter permease [Anaerolineae bacterium]
MVKIEPRRVFTGFTAHAVLIAGGLLMVLPFVWMVSTSFKPPTEVLVWPPKLIPDEPTTLNYPNVLETAPFARYFFNSVFVSTVSTISIIATSLIAGFVFAKYEFPLRDFLFILILATAIFPFETYMVPFYVMMVKLKWIDTYQGIIAPYLIMSFGIFLMRQNIRATIPDELLDAARIDGCSEWRIFTQIVVPLCSSAVGALGIFAFIQAWAAFIWPLLIAQSKALFNMELGLTVFQHRFSVEYHLLAAGAVLSVLPMITVFIILRRRIIEGITLTGLKG